VEPLLPVPYDGEIEGGGAGLAGVLLEGFVLEGFVYWALAAKAVPRAAAIRVCLKSVFIDVAPSEKLDDDREHCRTNVAVLRICPTSG
jgi:hypothetical protein